MTDQAERPYQGQDDSMVLNEIRTFLKALNTSGGKPLEELSPSEARQVLIGAQESVSFDYSEIEESERTIEQNGLQVKIHITKPEGAAPGAPVFIFIHGGGWILGDYPTHRRLV